MTILTWTILAIVAVQFTALFVVAPLMAAVLGLVLRRSPVREVNTGRPCERPTGFWTTVAWALFGNQDDGPYGIYPATAWGALRWWLRNPAHNLQFYILGVRHRNTVTVLWDIGGLRIAMTRLESWPVPILPFIQYYRTGWVKAYLGWRPGGAFGGKLHPDSGTA